MQFETQYIFMMFVGALCFSWCFLICFLQVLYWAMYGHDND